MNRRRGAQGSPAVDEADRARKRRKQSSEAAGDPRALFEAVWNYQERNRDIRQHFQVLPPQDIYPDYYEKIASPISLEEIRTKLDAGEYANVGAVKRDLFLMCDNAVKYNKSKSQVHSDALRLRKVTENYEGPTDAATGGGAVTAAQPEQPQQPQQTLKPTPKPAAKPLVKPTATPARTIATKASKQVMSKLVEDMMNLKGADGRVVSMYFKNLPSKKTYGDYFRLIKRPISLGQIQKRVKDGKYPQWAEFEEDVFLIKKNALQYNPVGSDVVKDARELEEYFVERLAEEKANFTEPSPPPPPPPTPPPPPPSGIKLRLSLPKGQQVNPPAEQSPLPKIKLNVGKQQPPPPPTPVAEPAPVAAPPAQVVTPPAPKIAPSVPKPAPPAPKPTPIPEPTKQPVANGDSVVPRPPPQNIPVVQKPVPVPQRVEASIPQPAPPSSPPRIVHNHQPPPPPPRASLPASVVHALPVPAPPPRARMNSIRSNGSGSPPPGSVMGRRSATPHSQSAMSPPAHMPPPPMQRMNSTPRPSSYSPAPHGPVMRSASVAGPTSAPQIAPQIAIPYQHKEPTVRSEGKDKSDALISKLHIAAMSSMNIAVEPYSIDLEPDDRKVTAQYYIHLSADLDTVTIVPTLAATLTSREQYIVRVAHWSNNMQMTKLLQQVNQQAKNEPVYNIRLSPGVVNTIEVTAVTQAPQKNGTNGVFSGGVDLWEMERFRVFISPV